LGTRRTLYTHSTAGLLFGLFGGAVSAFFAYLVTITADGAFVLDPGTAINALAHIGDLPAVRWPSVALDPFLPVVQAMVAVLCSLSAARHVGPSLISRSRLLWTALFGLALALGVLTTETAAQQSHWLGLAITLIALSLPHHTEGA
jgi:hypothetical protein